MKLVGAILLLLLAAGLGLIEGLAVFDPTGTRMADDADPFGRAHVPWALHAVYVAAIFASLGVAVLLLRRRK